MVEILILFLKDGREAATITVSEAQDFQVFINNHELIDLPLKGGNRHGEMTKNLHPTQRLTDF